MLTNVGMQNRGLVAWNGAASIPRDIRRYVNFGFTFEVTAALAADTILKVQAHDPDPADNCAPGPGRDVPEISICDVPAVPGPSSQFVIPAGTPIGTICAGTIPCRPAAFVSLAGVSGDVADVLGTIVLSGPMV